MRHLCPGHGDRILCLALVALLSFLVPSGTASSSGRFVSKRTFGKRRFLSDRTAELGKKFKGCHGDSDFTELLVAETDYVGLGKLMNVVVVFLVLSELLLAFDLWFLIGLFTKFLSPYQFCPQSLS